MHKRNCLKHIPALFFTGLCMQIFAGCFFAGVNASSLVLSQKKSADSANYSGTVVLRMAEQAREIHPAARASEYFAKLVKIRSEGKINIKVYYAGELGNSSEIIKQLRFGGIALGRVSFAELSEAVPAIYDFSKDAITQPLICRNLIEENMEFLADKCQMEKLYPLSVFYPDKRCFYSDLAKHYRSSMRFFNGLKIGTDSCRIIHEVLEEYGAVPVDMISADTYQSMQKGFMNVRESEFTDFILGSDYRFANYVMISDYISNPGMIVMSNEVWNQLNIEQREIIQKCAQDAAEYQKTMMDKFYSANLSTVQKQKLTLYLKQY